MRVHLDFIKSNVKYIVLLFIPFLMACSDKISTKQEVNYWVNDESNGYLKTQSFGDIVVTCKYQPSELLAVNEVGSFQSVAYEKTLDHYKNSYSFVIEFVSKEGQDVLRSVYPDYQEYAQAINKFSFEADQMFTASGEKNTVNASLVLFERGVNPIREHRFNVVYPKIEGDHIKLSFDHHDLGIGKIQFEYDMKKLRLPI